MSPELEDTTLVEAAQAGDQRALDRLLRRHEARIHAICRRMAGNDADALDATQEALIAIVKGLPRFDGRAKFTTWAHRVATNACLDELRRRGRRPDPGLPEHEHRDERFLGGPASTDPAETVSTRLELDDALAALPDEFLAPVVLRDVGGLDYAEIAAALDLAPGTVRSRIARGRRRLAASITGDSGNQTPPRERPTNEP